MRGLKALFLVVLAGCGGGGGNGEGTVDDTTPPVVLGFFHEAADTDIQPERVSVVFSEAIEPASITTSSFRLTDTNGASVPGSLAVEPMGLAAVNFTPQQPLARSTQYRLEVTTDVRDLAGNTLAVPFAPFFTTIPGSAWRATPITPATPAARLSHAAVWTGTEMIVFGGALNWGMQTTPSGARYTPATDSWTAIAGATLTGVVRAVWTGSEMIVWNGVAGERYNPATDSWLPVNRAWSPGGLGGSYTAVWTGSEMITWGTFDSGGRFNPAAGTWTTTSMTGAPSPRILHTAVWTGTEMIIWGGIRFGGDSRQLSDGARYNPATDTWTPVSNVNAPSARSLHTAVWTGTEMIVWSGASGTGFNSGGRYNPATDTWLPVSANPLVSLAQYLHTAVWTGTEMIVWGGAGGFRPGGRYNPATDTWRPVTMENNATARMHHTVVWTGTEMIVWGGTPVEGGTPPPLQTGARYTP
jgi:N-acetylneuraminic acid mutarotase